MDAAATPQIRTIIDYNADNIITPAEVKTALTNSDAAVKDFFESLPAMKNAQLSDADMQAVETALLSPETKGNIIITDKDGKKFSVKDGKLQPVTDASPAPGLAAPAEADKPAVVPDDSGPTQAEPLARINDPSKAFRKDAPEEIRQKATDGTLTAKEAKMWATTTSREGRALLGISGRMDAADRDILIKQRFARKAGEKAAESESPEAAAVPEKPKTEGTTKSAARVITNAASAPVRLLMKGAGVLAGIFSKGAKDKLNEWADDLKWQKPSTKAPVEAVSEHPTPPPTPEIDSSGVQGPLVTTRSLPYPPKEASAETQNNNPGTASKIDEIDVYVNSAKSIVDNINDLSEKDGTELEEPISRLLEEAQTFLQLTNSTLYGEDIDRMLEGTPPDLTNLDEKAYQEALDLAKQADQKAREAKALFEKRATTASE